jgi:replication factor C subunit 1
MEGLINNKFRRILTTPSSKTSYVVLGSDPGPSKLELIKKHNLKTLSESEFLQLLDSFGKPEVPKPVASVKFKNHHVTAPYVRPEVKSNPPSSILWTEKYKPTAYDQVIGNKSNLDKLVTFLNNW